MHNNYIATKKERNTENKGTQHIVEKNDICFYNYVSYAHMKCLSRKLSYLLHSMSSG